MLISHDFSSYNTSKFLLLKCSLLKIHPFSFHHSFHSFPFSSTKPTKNFSFTFSVILFFSKQRRTFIFLLEKSQYKKSWMLLLLTLPVESTRHSLCYERWFGRSIVNLQIHLEFLNIDTRTSKVYSKPSLWIRLKFHSEQQCINRDVKLPYTRVWYREESSSSSLYNKLIINLHIDEMLC